MQETGPSAATRPLAAVAAPSEATDPRHPQFDRYYFEHECGTPYGRNAEWLEWFDRVADDIVARLAPARVLDAGCALGLLVEKLRERGVEAWGIDISDFAISQVHESVRGFCAVGSLVDPLPDELPSSFDLVTCIEVIEHMPPADGERALAQLTTLSDRILFSSSPTDFLEATHLNVRPSEHWSALFARAGFLRNLHYDSRLPTRWTSLYERAICDVSEIVRRYDRELFRARDEIGELRDATLDLKRQLQDLDDAVTLTNELHAAVTRAETAESELGTLREMLETRTGRWFRAYHAARRALGRSS